MRFADLLVLKLRNMAFVEVINITARGTFLKMLMPLLHPFPGDQRKDNTVLRYYDWTQQADTKKFCVPAALYNITLPPSQRCPQDAELGCQGLPRSDSFHYQVQFETHLHDISLTCPPVPEKLMQ
jgi:hypothetical protein